MREESKNRFVIGVGGAFSATWIMALMMAKNGNDGPDDLAWPLISGLRWLCTTVVVICGLGYLIAQWWSASEKAEQEATAAYEKAISDEVERRLSVIREREWQEKERIRRIEEKRKEEERQRLALEAKWRKEFEEKIEEENRLKQTATEATQSAFEEFI